MATRLGTRALPLPRRRKRTPEYRRLHPRWPWWTPVFVVFTIIFLPFLLVRIVAACLGIGIIVLITRRPERALRALLILLPFHAEIFAGLYRIGVPGDVVRAGGQWKEMVAVGIIAAGIRRGVTERHRLDRLDLAGLVFIALGTAYFLVPSLLLGDAPGTRLDFSTRLLGWRTDIMYVALFLGARHLRLAPEAMARVVKTFIAVATVVAAIAFFEFAAPSTWNMLISDKLELWRYKIDVLNVNPANDIYLYDVRVYTSVGGRQVLRVGSVTLYYAALGFYLMTASAILASRLVRGVATSKQVVALGLTAGAIMLTQTRSAILGLCVIFAITLLRRTGRAEASERAAASRVRFTLLLGALAAVALPAALAMGLVDRFQGEDDISSNTYHAAGRQTGYRIVAEHPLGRGLATAAGAGQLGGGVDEAEITEIQALQVATQLGVFGLLLWLGITFGTVVAFGRAVARAPASVDTGEATAMRAALIGMLIAGLFLQTFIEFTVSWSLWPLLGAALGSLEAANRRVRDEPVGWLVGSDRGR